MPKKERKLLGERMRKSEAPAGFKNKPLLSALPLSEGSADIIMVHTYIRLMAEILHRQLCVIYESSGCSPYEPLISRHERWCRNVKMKGVHRNNSSSRLVQDFGHHTCFRGFPLLYFLLYKTTSKQQFVAVEFWSKSLRRCFLNGGSNFIWPGRYWLAASLMTTRWLSHVTLFWVFSIIFFSFWWEQKSNATSWRWQKSSLPGRPALKLKEEGNDLVPFPRWDRNGRANAFGHELGCCRCLGV